MKFDPNSDLEIVIARESLPAGRQGSDPCPEQSHVPPRVQSEARDLLRLTRASPSQRLLRIATVEATSQ